MQTFEVQLDPVDWTEILQDGTYIAFDIIEAKRVELYFTETDSTPATSVGGNFVECWPNRWDYEGSGFDSPSQSIWARGDASIRGVRA